MKHLILLHGAIGAQQQLDQLAALLTPHFVLHRPNFSGHGGMPYADDFSMEQFSKELLLYVQSLPPAEILTGVCVFGYSMGGYVALLAAQQQPALFSTVVTLGTKWKWDEGIAENETALLNPGRIEAKLPAFAAQLENRHAPNDWKELLHKTADMLLGLGRNNPVESIDLSVLQIPLLLLVGDRDTSVSLAETKDMMARLPKGAMGVLPHSHHPVEKVNLRLLYQMILQAFEIDG
jgi:pimeloyl-ACP methyl ester carboxylesterase